MLVVEQGLIANAGEFIVDKWIQNNQCACHQSSLAPNCCFHFLSCPLLKKPPIGETPLIHGPALIPSRKEGGGHVVRREDCSTGPLFLA